jgi:hypothetical protein
MLARWLMPEQLTLPFDAATHWRLDPDLIPQGLWERWPEDRGERREEAIRSPLLCGKEA